MLDRIRQRITYANVVATLALLIALGGSGYAAVQINGKTIKNGTIAGVKLRKDTLTGRQVNEARLGKVPRAGRADSAVAADTAVSATRAASAGTLDGIASSGFLRSTPPEAFHEVGASGEPAFGPGWTGAAAQALATTVGFSRDPLGVVRLKGTVTRGATAGPTIFTLPDGDRPTKIGCFPSLASVAQQVAAVMICVRQTGTVDLTSDPPAGLIQYTLDGITFRAGAG